MTELTIRCACGRRMAVDALRGRGAYRCGCGTRIIVQASEPQRRCAGYRDGEHCRSVPVAGLPADLCADHVAELQQMWRTDRPEDDKAAWERFRTGSQRPARLPLVYYVRFADRIKIGTTANLAERLREVPHDVLLGVEAGGRDVEGKRHEQFRELRLTREWFRAAQPLLDHIAQLGRPVSWDAEPAAVSLDAMLGTPGLLLSGPEAADLAGVMPRTIYAWRRRGFLTIRGLDECGQELYDAAEVARVQATPRRRAQCSALA